MITSMVHGSNRLWLFNLDLTLYNVVIPLQEIKVQFLQTVMLQMMWMVVGQ